MPLTGGLRQDVSNLGIGPSSSASLTNFLPLDGALIVRSRSSSRLTIPTRIEGIAPYVTAAGAAYTFISSRTRAYWFNSPTLSEASFTSSHGIGTFATTGPQGDTQRQWQFAQIYSPIDNENILVCARRSQDTLVVAKPTMFSYCTQAPGARCVAAFDNYVLAANIYNAVAGNLVSRIQWSDRGDPYNWTTGLSGFEDLVAMRGAITRIVLLDNRIIIFSDHEIWYGVQSGAIGYTAFQFAPLDTQVGCPYPGTIVETDNGLIFLDQSGHVRLLAKGAAISQIISSSVRPIIQSSLSSIDKLPNQQLTFATYDPTTRIYTLWLRSAGTLSQVQLAINISTGAWSQLQFGNLGSLALGGQHIASFSNGIDATLIGDQSGVIHSLSSTVANDTYDSSLQAIYQSPIVGREYGAREKTVREIRISYQVESQSTATVKMSWDGGTTFESDGKLLHLAPTSARSTAGGVYTFSSGVSQAVAYPYGSSKYPTFQLTSQSTGLIVESVSVLYHIRGR